MTKGEFLDAIRRKLSGLPSDDIERSLDYYRELLDDAAEDGMDEAEAVASLGSADAVARQILGEFPLAALARLGTRRSRVRSAGTFLKTAALCTGLWLAVVLVYFFTIVCATGAVGGLAGAVLLAWSNNLLQAILIAGLALIFIGLVILLALTARQVTTGAVRQNRRIVGSAKTEIIRKGLA